jgi:hypothetical protein
VEDGVHEVRLGLDTRCLQDAHVGGAIASISQQAGLADTRFAPQQQPATTAHSSGVEYARDGATLLLARQQHLRIVDGKCLPVSAVSPVGARRGRAWQVQTD